MVAAQPLALRALPKTLFGSRVPPGVDLDAAALARLLAGRSPEAGSSSRATQEEIGGVRLTTREAGRHRLPRLHMRLRKSLRH
jgi:hypothetical protein